MDTHNNPAIETAMPTFHLLPDGAQAWLADAVGQHGPSWRAIKAQLTEAALPEADAIAARGWIASRASEDSLPLLVLVSERSINSHGGMGRVHIVEHTVRSLRQLAEQLDPTGRYYLDAGQALDYLRDDGQLWLAFWDTPAGRAECIEAARGYGVDVSAIDWIDA